MSRGLVLGCALGLLALWFAALAARPLFNPDEGRYAEIPREMLAGGDWVIPHLNGFAYIEKPPLQYWATALAIAAFGASAWVARLYTTLCAFACVAVIAWTAHRLWGAAASWRAAAVSGSLLLFLVLAHVLTLDMSLSFWMTACLCAFLLAQDHAQRADARAARRAMLAAWVCAALGVMTKGLVAALIPGAVLLIYTAYRRDLSPWRRLHALPGLALFLAITVPWHVLAQRRLPDFAEFFFVREHFARFMTPVADREQPAWFFAVMFLVGTLPWTGGALRALATGWARLDAPGFDTRAFLRLWVLFILLFFSLSDSKLIPYILPALPALGLLMAAQPADVRRRDALQASLLALCVGAALAATLAALPWLAQSAERAPYFLALRPAMGGAAALLLWAGLWSRRCWHTNADPALPLAAGWTAAVLLLLLGARALAPVYSGATLVEALPAAVRATAPVYSVRTYDQGLPFYWRRPVTLVEYRGELDYGLRHDPHRAIASIEEFRLRWQQLDQGFAIMEPDTLNTLRAQGLPMRVVARDVHRVLVARR
ncbi:MAG: glycosyltransferase family 39 protein [Proteobacteria bacterium]|nr:glycosyltransferase family 39 protein [Pseudomonadota bacterium]